MSKPAELGTDSLLNSPILRQRLYSSGRERVFVHAFFWVGIGCLTIYWNNWVLKEADWKVYVVVTLTDIIEISVSYYLIALFGLPKLYARKWVQFLGCLLAVYVFESYVNYFLYRWLSENYHLLERLASAIGENGAWFAPFQKYTLLINWSFALSSLGIPVTLKVLKDILTARTKTAELERDNIRLELQFLQAQIQPHFVLNSINSVYSVVAGTDDEAATMLLRLSGLLRYALHETSSPTVSLFKEVEFLREYIGLEAVRQHERTTLSFQHDGSLDGFEIPPLLLVTFIENAFKHGINATYRQAWADVRLQITTDGTLHFRVENSKPSTDVRRNGKKQPPGIGIDNTRRRLNLLFPGKHNLSISHTDDTFTVNLMLQLTRQKEKQVTQPTLIMPANGATHV